MVAKFKTPSDYFQSVAPCHQSACHTKQVQTLWTWTTKFSKSIQASFPNPNNKAEPFQQEISESVQQISSVKETAVFPPAPQQINVASCMARERTKPTLRHVSYRFLRMFPKRLWAEAEIIMINRAPSDDVLFLCRIPLIDGFIFRQMFCYWVDVVRGYVTCRRHDRLSLFSFIML